MKQEETSISFTKESNRGKLVSLDYQSEVPILGPVGYGPTTLPLRHSDADERIDRRTLTGSVAMANRSPPPVSIIATRSPAQTKPSTSLAQDSWAPLMWKSRNDSEMALKGSHLDLRAFLLRGHTLRLFRAALRSAKRAPESS